MAEPGWGSQFLGPEQVGGRVQWERAPLHPRGGTKGLTPQQPGPGCLLPREQEAVACGCGGCATHAPWWQPAAPAAPAPYLHQRTSRCSPGPRELGPNAALRDTRQAPAPAAGGFRAPLPQLRAGSWAAPGSDTEPHPPRADPEATYCLGRERLWAARRPPTPCEVHAEPRRLYAVGAADAAQGALTARAPGALTSYTGALPSTARPLPSSPAPPTEGR